MRHAPLDVFTASCLDMHGEYILTVVAKQHKKSKIEKAQPTNFKPKNPTI
jgi:hypothetical protein